ncbi:Calcineurin-like phosphoesterase superfamily domain containing protein [Desulfovibrio sp. X2]|uniref:metallophosphoesterase n=1 Tax=Desulfovibrio sp. X2 TaxID=941449 RepID=UPI000358D0B0|nr:metallophosphoesterase [Desulfovibrio sp. X2]EPR41415.1 Calcineurin-like phosphoesterase superfamily domain containing protein [Desulfovibrio sp. X2]
MDEKIYVGFGDVHGQTANAARIPGIAEAAGVIVSGDLSNLGGKAEAEAVLAAVRAANPTVYAQIGNMDRAAADEALSAAGANIHRKAVELPGGAWLMGAGWSTTTPFGTPSEIDDATLGAWLEETWAKVGDPSRLILVCHTPPLDTAVDVVGSGAHVGSAAVRDFILRREPAVCLTGHIHESAAEDSLGRTRVVNPGMLADGGYALIRVRPESIVIEHRRIGQGA